MVEVELDDGGLPREVAIDHVPDAIDDEECYRDQQRWHDAGTIPRSKRASRDSTYPDRVGGKRGLRVLAAGIALICVAGCGGGGGADPKADALDHAGERRAEHRAHRDPGRRPGARGRPTRQAHRTAGLGRHDGLQPHATARRGDGPPDRARSTACRRGRTCSRWARRVIENQALTVAAVDPATYRNFTPVGERGDPDVWDRVAGGELALSPDAGQGAADRQGRVPPPRQRPATRPQVHIGAYAPQVEGRRRGRQREVGRGPRA